MHANGHTKRGQKLTGFIICPMLYAIAMEQVINQQSFCLSSYFLNFCGDLQNILKVQLLHGKKTKATHTRYRALGP